jgi:hypothetical protein
VPTAAELTIVLEAQDRASAQLQQVGAQVTRLERQVVGFVGRAGSRGLLGALTGGLGIGAGIEVAERAFDAVRGVAAGVGDAVFGMNSRLEDSVTAFRVFSGSAQEARRIVQELRREADITPFNTQEVIEAGQALTSSARTANVSLLELVRTAEALAAYRPTQGLEGATVALREALEGDLQSIRERFGITSAAIQRFRDQGQTNLQAIQSAMREVGATTELVEQMGRTFEGRRSTVASFFAELQQRLGAGLFDRASEGLAHLVNLINRYGEQLKQFASDLGAVIGIVAERLAGLVTGPIQSLLAVFAPGLWEQINAELSTIPESLTQTTQAAQQAAPAVESLNLQLARVGVQAAEVQVQADRVRRSYDDQLEPLQRQLRLLQQSAEVQRVQNALATNRATVENLRLDREIAALQRAARGQEDPNAPGLTLRQRAIALALQERRLRQEELGLTERQRPAIQTLQEQIAAIQEQQRQALAPLEAQLANFRDQAAALRLVKEQTDLAKQAEVERGQAIRDTGRGPATPEALEDSRKRGEALADAWLTAYQKWIDDNGGSLWEAVVTSFRKWWAAGGKEQTELIGGLIGGAIWAGMLAIITAGPSVQDLFKAWITGQLETEQQRWRDILNRRAEQVFGPAAAPGGPLGPRVAAGPAAEGGAAPVNVGDVSVTVEGVQEPTLAARLKTALSEFLKNFIAAQSLTGPGADVTLQGAGR